MNVASDLMRAWLRVCYRHDYGSVIGMATGLLWAWLQAYYELGAQGAEQPQKQHWAIG